MNDERSIHIVDESIYVKLYSVIIQLYHITMRIMQICKSEPIVFDRVTVSLGIEAHDTNNNAEKITTKILLFIFSVV